MSNPPRSPATPVQSLIRRPFTGSCHCGHISYILYITLPITKDSPSPPSTTSPYSSPLTLTGSAAADFTATTHQSTHRCNCTVCHKMGLLHFIPASPHDDFLLVRPAMSEDAKAEGITNYCRAGSTENPLQPGGFAFCNRCGVRCFSMACKWETKKLILENGDGKEVEVSVPKSGRFEKGSGLSVNLLTIDARQEGFDLRVWQEKGWVAYLQLLDDDDSKYPGENGRKAGRPWKGGMW